MASQPANQDISVFRRVRSYREDLRHNSILDLAQGHFRRLIMSVPSEEVLVTETRDPATEDLIVTTALDQDRTGLPVVRGLKPVVSLAEAVEGISGLNFPIRMPGHRDVFLEKSDASKTDDLHQDLRDVKDLSL